MVIVPKYMLRLQGVCYSPGVKVSVDDSVGKRLVDSRLATVHRGKDGKDPKDKK